MWIFQDIVLLITTLRNIVIEILVIIIVSSIHVYKRAVCSYELNVICLNTIQWTDWLKPVYLCVIIIIIIIYFCSFDPKEGNSPQDVEHVIINIHNTMWYIQIYNSVTEKDQQQSRIDKYLQLFLYKISWLINKYRRLYDMTDRITKLH